MIASLTANPRLLALATVLLTVLGLLSLGELPQLEDPRIPNRVAVVLTPYPGANASRVEALVTERIESTLQQLPEIKILSSESRDGLSVVIMELKDEIYPPEIDSVWARARDRVAEVRADLPAGVLASRLDDRSGHTLTMLIGLRWRGPGQADHAVLGRYARELESRLWSVPDTEYLETAGRRQEEVLVSVDPARAAQAGLDFATLGRLMGEADAKLATGSVSGSRVEATVELRGEFDSEERIRRVPLVSGVDGRQLRLGDIATVERGLAEPATEIALIDGEPGVIVGTRMGQRRHIGEWTGDVERLLQEYRGELPANVQLDVLFSQNTYTAVRMDKLRANLLGGFLLVVAVLLLCMGWRSALVVASSLPLMTGFTLVCMRAADMGLNQMSVSGIILALGIMVDNAIIVADTVVANRRAGMAAAPAASAAVRHLWMPLLGSTLTTILGFMPAVLMEGPAAEFPGAVARAVVFSLIGSLAISCTLVAALVALAERTPSIGQRESWWITGMATPRLAARFRASLHAALARPARAVALALALPLLGLALLPTLDQQFFPHSDRDAINVEVYLAEGASIEATRAAVDTLDAALRANPEVRRLHWLIGRSVPPYFYSLLRRHDGMQNFAQGMVQVADRDAVEAMVPVLQRELAHAAPGALVLVRELVQGPPYNAPVELRLSGPDIDVLHARGEELRALAAALPEVRATRATLGEGVPRVELDLPEEWLHQAGLSFGEAARQVRAALAGVEQGSITEGTEDVPVRVRIGAADRRGADDLDLLQFVLGAAPVAGRPSGIALPALGEVRLASGRSTVPRRGARRENAIEVFPEPGQLAEPLLRRLQAAIAASDFALPLGYRLEVGGEDEKQRWANDLLAEHVPELALLLGLVVVLSFNSFRLGGLILGIGGVSIACGLLVLSVFGIPFGFIVVFALMALMGLAINAAIVVLAELRTDPACREGDAEAIVSATARCGRHIIAATATTVLGLAPLMVDDNAFFANMARPVGIGTLIATVLSMYLVPIAWRALRRPVSL